MQILEIVYGVKWGCFYEAILFWTGVKKYIEKMRGSYSAVSLD